MRPRRRSRAARDEQAEHDAADHPAAGGDEAQTGHHGARDGEEDRAAESTGLGFPVEGTGAAGGAGKVPAPPGCCVGNSLPGGSAREIRSTVRGRTESIIHFP